MTFIKTPPTEPVPHYWREHGKAEWKTLELFINDIGYLTTNIDDSFQPVEEIGGEWGGRVPAPGTTWTVEEIQEYVRGQVMLSAVDGHEPVRFQQYNQAVRHICNELSDEEDGIKAFTERNKKEGV